MDKTRNLTPAQAKWLKVRAKDSPSRSFYGAFHQAIDELTAKPGDAAHCESCEWWGRELERWYEDCGVWGERWIEYDDLRFCGHGNFDGKHCPEGRWEEKGGDD